MGVKIKNMKILIWPFCRTFDFTPFSVFFLLRLTAKLNILAAFKILLFFPKWRNMTSRKRHFLKKKSTDFSEILVTGVKLMLEKVLKVSRRYLPLFLSYRENPAGGAFAPNSGARVNQSLKWVHLR